MASCWRAPRLQLGFLVLLAACQPADERDAGQPAVVASATPEAEPAAAAELTCSGPVRATDTVASLQSRFGDKARTETLGGAEGSEFAGLALWPDDPARRLEVFFGEDGAKTVSFVRLGEKAKWRVAGLRLGDPLGRVREANGKPITFWGFEWDYGGYSTDLAGGRLAGLADGCRVSLRFDVREAVVVPHALLGEVYVSSDDPRLETVDVRLVELGLGFAAVKAGK